MALSNKFFESKNLSNISAYSIKNENPGDIQEIFELKKSRRWEQKSRRYPGDFQEIATLQHLGVIESTRACFKCYQKSPIYVQ